MDVVAGNFDFKSSTYSEVAQLVDVAERVIRERGIRFTSQSVLHKLFADARKLEREWSDSSKSPGLVTGINAVYAEKIARVVIDLIDAPGVEEAMQRIAGSDINLSNRFKSQGKDALWELSLLTTLLRKQIKAELVDPPDIVVELRTGSYSIACKKIYELKSLSSRLRDGAKQISKSGSPGIIALNIDDLLPGDHILTSQSPKVALDILSTATKRFFEKNHNAFDKLRTKSCLDGVLISASTISDITATSTRLNMTTSFNFYPFRSDGLGYDRSFELIRKLSPNGLAGVSPYRVFSYR
ncbi:hypothetical protein PHLH6_28560 [Pseudomonas sp. Seg1]|uniref:hypothetical protein n=1 Tax=Pseudomonas sp. Seg1 TaxID=2678259 RepID=UPI001BB427AB|nr:hypothetical protein [Pseudomonas sp. Seg1]BBP70852.1 hypothetical protein PHLH6_28560 [Pseudomonas sp. Seg1]